MVIDDERIWWPFDLSPRGHSNLELQVKATFLESAYRDGFRSYVQRDDCGAVSSEGMEVVLVWRGRGRTELLLIRGSTVEDRKLFTDASEGKAFRQASAEALDWLRSSTISRESIGSDQN